VTITGAQLEPYNLPLQQAWRTSGAGSTSRRGWLLRLEDSDGIRGYGDCAPLPSHGTETEEVAHSILESELTHLTGIAPEQALAGLTNHQRSPAARCALECALLDLITQRATVPMHLWLNPKSSPKVMVNANIGILDDGAIKRASAAIDQGYTTLKLKVGISDVPGEIAQLKLLCRELPASIQLRLDANRAWDGQAAIEFLQGISKLPIESLEEPLTQPELEALAQLQGQSSVSLALDETVAKLDRESLSRLGRLRRIILKPMVLGGLLPALQLGQHAQEVGIEVVVTTTVDSAAGVWMATQLAAALDVTGKLCHGLGTSAWLQRDLGAAPEIYNGTITIPATPGLGFRPYA
jgi:L-Ala-D/L-Glu epimerase